MNATDTYASALEKTLPKMGSWKRDTSTLVGAGAPVLSQGLRAALMLLPGDDIKPGRVRVHLDQLVNLAKNEESKKVPWTQLIVLYVFENGAPPEMRTLIGNDRRVVSSKQVVQGGWIDLRSNEANFRSSRTPFETELLGLMVEAAGGSNPSVESSARRAADAAKAAAAKTKVMPAVDGAGETLPRRLPPIGTFLVLGVLAVLTTVLAFDQFAALRYGAMQANVVQQGQLYRFLSAVFAQNGWAEFAVTATTLFLLGTALERVYGTITFLALFAACAVGAAAGNYAYGGPQIYNGAAEAVLGLCGAIGVAAFRYRDAELLSSLAVRGGLALFGGYLFLTLLGGPAIAKVLHPHAPLCWQAMVSGLASGLLLALVVPSPKPSASLIWKVMSPFLLVLASAPFAGLGYAVYAARVTAARPVFVDPKGFSVQAPLDTVLVKGQDGAIFMGSMFNINPNVMTTLHLPPGATIDSYKDELLSDLAIRHMTVKTSDISTIGPLKWLVVRATQADGRDRQYGYAIEGSTIYLVTMWGPYLDNGATAFHALLESFSPVRDAASTAKKTH